MKSGLQTCLTAFIVWGWSFLHSSIAQQERCKTIIFNDEFDGKILERHIFTSFPSVDSSNCQVHCYMDSRCISFNFHTSKSLRPYTCELSDSDHLMNPQDFKESYGTIYSNIENNCSCSNQNMTCRINFLQGTTRCECKPGYTGENCSIRIDYCQSNPCENNSTCVNDIDSYNCSCLSHFSGKNCSRFVGWMSLSTLPICIGSRDDSFGKFTIVHTGSVRTFKLIHQSGGVSTIGSANEGNWGTTVLGLTRHEILITFENNTVIAPPPEKTQFSNLFGQMGYDLQNQTNMSPELIFPDFEPPLEVVSNQTFRIWFGQDLTNTFESDNSGTTCALLEILYV